MSLPSPANSSPFAAAEQRAGALLAQEKWRQARDELKPLVKADRARFLPLLIQANLGLARKMIAAGQVSEARQVLNYLATIAPAGPLRALELECAARSGTPGTALPQLVAALADADAALSQTDRRRLADQAVLTFASVAVESTGQAQIAAEVRAIHQALDALARADWAGVSEALRLVPHRSVCSHWAVFIKGVAAFQAGDAERATRLLRGLAPDSVPGRAGRAYLRLLPAEGGVASSETCRAAAVTEAELAAVCRLAGAGGVAGLLLRADHLWREGKHAESYRVLRDGVPAFPSSGLDWAGALSEFYFKAPHSMPESEWFPYLRFFDELIARARLKKGAEAMFAYRTLALMGQAIAPAHELRDDWEIYLAERQMLHGTNARLLSLAHGWLGERLAMVRPARGFHSGPPKLRDPQGAVEALRRSIELDATNRAAHLQLCAVYDALSKNSERNRLLDTMTARFPDDKDVLLHAAEGCIERRAFAKGLDYLARARQLDQLDPRIPEATVAALQAQARQHFRQGRLEKARSVLGQANEWLIDKPDDFRRSRWSALVRHGVIERIWGDAVRCEALIASANGSVPTAAAPPLFAHLAHRLWSKTWTCDSPFLVELSRALSRELRLADILWLLRIVEFWRPEMENLQTDEEVWKIAGAAAAALDRPFSRTEVAEFVERTRSMPEFYQPVDALLKKLLRDDPKDPQARLWEIERREMWTFEPSKVRAELQSILDEASRRRDEASVSRARRLLRDLDQPAPPDPVGPDLGEPELEETAGDDESDVDATGASGLPPEMLEEFGELIAEMRAAPEAALGELRKTATRGGMPEFVFDTLVAAAKGRPLLPPVPPGGLKPVAPKPPFSDPNQLNLF